MPFDNHGNTWDGVDRRNFIDPSSICSTCGIHSKSIDNMESKWKDEKPLDLATFKWAIGLVLGITLSLFGTVTYKAFDIGDQVHAVALNQEKVYGVINHLRADITDLKKYHGVPAPEPKPKPYYFQDNEFDGVQMP